MTEKAGLSDDQFSSLEKYVHLRKFSKGDFLLRQGDICEHSFFVEKGLLRSYTIDDTGKEHINQFAPENWIIADRSSAYFNEPSDYFIDALEACTVVLLNKDFAKEAARISAGYTAYNERALQNHIRQLQKRINALLGETAEQRYLNFVDTYYDLTLRVPQWMIASYLGITPESLSRVRKELARKNPGL
ncbi:MAG: Crp/Fnr family transcriptional regulator [Ferruginibacter sp.]